MRGTQGKKGIGIAATLQAAIGAAALLGGVTGCTTEGGHRALVIVQNQVPTIGDMGGGCTIPGKRTDSGPRGTLDVELDRPRAYQLYPLVTNLLPKFMDTDPYNPNLVTLQGFDVKLEPPPGITIPSDATCPMEFFAPSPNIVVAPGDEVASGIDIVLACHAARLRDMFDSNPPKLPASLSVEVVLTAKVRARGNQGGVTSLSDEFSFPVRVCRGCLQQGFEMQGYQTFGLDSASGDIVYPRCDQLTENPYKGNPCNPAQDLGPILCCSVDGSKTNIQCPAIPRGTTAP